jgi:hypothetical protein
VDQKKGPSLEVANDKTTASSAEDAPGYATWEFVVLMRYPEKGFEDAASAVAHITAHKIY